MKNEIKKEGFTFEDACKELNFNPNKTDGEDDYKPICMDCGNQTIVYTILVHTYVACTKCKKGLSRNELNSEEKCHYLNFNLDNSKLLEALK